MGPDDGREAQREQDGEVRVAPSLLGRAQVTAARPLDQVENAGYERDPEERLQATENARHRRVGPDVAVIVEPEVRQEAYRRGIVPPAGCPAAALPADDLKPFQMGRPAEQRPGERSCGQ